MFSSRAIERATYESIPFRFLAGNLHPDHDTIAHFRQRFLPQIKELFVQILQIATQNGVLTLTNVSVDGTKIHADASKILAVSHKRLLERQIQLASEVEALLELAQQADGTPVSNNLNILDNGYFSSTNIVGLHNREIVPYIATGRQPHYSTLPVLLPQHLVVPIQADTDKVKMAYTLRTEVGKEIYRLRKCTVEPVIGVIKEAIGFRQFSLRGLQKADGEWCLVCLAFNLRRLQVLLGNASASSPTTC